MKLELLLFALCLVSAEESAIQELTTANNLFSIDAYKQISNFEPGNFLVSPFSAETILALVQFGANGETAEELRIALNLPIDKNKIAEAARSVLSALRSSESFTLHTANKMYVKEDFPVKDEFNNIANTVFGAYVELIDFTKSEEAASNINNWVEKQTNEKIKNLISADDLDDETRAVLVNALYLKADWSKQFYLANTEKTDFYITPTETVSVDTLHHYKMYFNYYECSHLRAQFLELPFVGDVGSMVIVLPNEKDGLARLENSLEQVLNPNRDFTSRYLNVAIPKFKIETEIDFKTVLENLGVRRIFNASQADFSNIADTIEPLSISKVAQKTFVDVSEKGIEAAAATYVVVVTPMSGRSDKPKEFIANHPFIFYIKINGLILFAGRVTDPSTN